MSRKHERIEISQTILIEDVINGGQFGELINITVEGLMVMTPHELTTHAIYQLSLKLPLPVGGSDEINLGADCLWCRPADNFNRYWAGLQIIDVSDEAMEQIELLIEDYSK